MIRGGPPDNNRIVRVLTSESHTTARYTHEGSRRAQDVRAATAGGAAPQSVAGLRYVRDVVTLTAADNVYSTRDLGRAAAKVDSDESATGSAGGHNSHGTG